MIRILMPLAIIAAMYFGPMFSVETSDPVRGDSVSTVSGEYFIGNAVDCVKAGKVPLGKECASDGKMKGKSKDSTFVGDALSWAAMLSGAAALLGIPGMLPFIGRITSIATLASGIGSLAALGLFVVSMINSDAGLGAVQWGAYAAAGAALMTTISGLSGMRGR
ncbi:MAG: hypothetical protein R3C58_06760 [Parvularculaceae bacterium]